jgi:hypothetical protein
MKKVFLAFIAFLSFSSLFAVAMDSLSPQQRTEYNHKTLTIKATQVTRDSFSSNSTYNNGYGFGTSSGVSNTSVE